MVQTTYVLVGLWRQDFGSGKGYIDVFCFWSADTRLLYFSRNVAPSVVADVVSVVAFPHHCMTTSSSASYVL